MHGRKLKKLSNKERKKEKRLDKEANLRLESLSQSGVKDKPVGKLLTSIVYKH